MVQLCKKVDCTGCMACYNACSKDAIAVIRNDKGFNETLIDEQKCVECGLCVDCCPVLSPPLDNEIPKKCIAAYALDDSIRLTSSSGGLFGVIAKKIISKGGIVCGASFDTDMHLCHNFAEDIEGLKKLQGSKYTQSFIGDIYRSVKFNLQKGRDVLFVGTPCQVAGLKSYLRKRYDNLTLIDLLCHGVTSPGLFERYLKMAFSGQHVVDYQFRNYKGQSMDCVIKVQPENKLIYHKQQKTKIGNLTKEKHIYGESSYYLSLFQNGLAFREACYNCKFNRLPRQGDISLGDFWGIGMQTPYNPPKKKGGTSFVLINSDKGNKIFKRVKDNLYFEEREISEASILNPNIIRASSKPDGYDCFWEDFVSLKTDELIKKYKLKVLKKPSLKNQVKIIIKKILHI